MAAVDIPGRVGANPYGKPGRHGTTTLTSVSSGSTFAKRRNESGQPCSNTTVGASEPATWWIERIGGSLSVITHGRARSRSSVGRQP
jgi:hypothetical protein